MSSLLNSFASLDKESQKKLLALAMKKVTKERLSNAFDPEHPDSRPTPQQDAILREFSQIKTQWVVAGNQCLAKGTLVLTPQGARPIEEIGVGDTVYDENGKSVKVLNNFANGVKSVYPLQHMARTWAEATLDHRWLTNKYNHRDQDTGILEEKETRSLARHKIKRTFVRTPMGPKEIPYAYGLGVMIGDGCCTCGSDTRLLISSANEGIVRKAAQDFGGPYKKNTGTNFTWTIYSSILNKSFYLEWCKDKKAHQKRLPYEELQTWNRESLIRLIAGIYDTDGSISYSEKYRTITFSISLQAQEVIFTLQKLFLSLWQIPVSVSLDNRDKYVNGPVLNLQLRNPHEIKRVLAELGPHIISPQKQWKQEYSSLGKRSYPDKISIKLGEPREVETFDLEVDSPTHLYLLANGMVTHNSGKSTIGARLTSWVFTETHPHWTRPEEWKSEPLLILVAGRTGKQIEESLVPKITSYLEEGTYKIVRVGNIAQRIENLLNGNRIIFQSLENPNIARERVQSYVAHMVWLDEMPATAFIVDELRRRVQAREGNFIATFTPLVANTEIRKVVDSADGTHAKLYKIAMLDNPIYNEPSRKENLLRELASLPDSIRNARLYGDWVQGEEKVFHFDYAFHVRELPPHYSAAWRHVESSDPAVNTKFGFTLWAEDPVTQVWYCIKAEYIANIFYPEKILEEVLKRTEGYNITRRICDSHESWYIHTASQKGITYMTPHDKSNRKMAMFKAGQQALGTRVVLTPWCTHLIDELQGMQWSPVNPEKIAQASHYHLIDSFVYFIDNIPKPVDNFVPPSWDAALRIQHEKAKKKIEATKKASTNRRMRVGNTFRWKRR